MSRHGTLATLIRGAETEPVGAVRSPAIKAQVAPGAPADPLPADALLHPVTLAALSVLLINDHVLKAAWPGPVTGKLSDLAGLVFFPILLLSGTELALALVRRWRRPTIRALGLAVAISAIGFVLSKTVPVMADGSGWLLGGGQWLLSLPIRIAAGLQVPPIAPAIVVADTTDLVALPCLAVALWIGMSRMPGIAQVERDATATKRTR
jgi:hypothetical protein